MHVVGSIGWFMWLVLWLVHLLGSIGWFMWLVPLVVSVASSGDGARGQSKEYGRESEIATSLKITILIWSSV